MATTDVQDLLVRLLGDPAEAAGQADLLQAATLVRQEVSFRQRAGAAAARLRRARAAGAEAGEIARLEADLDRRRARLDAAGVQARAADLKRPVPDPDLAQVFGRARGAPEAPPLTAAALVAGKAAALAPVLENGSFHLTHPGALTGAVIQISDSRKRILHREARPIDIPAGAVAYLDVAIGPPEPEPGPAPEQLTMPKLVGQTEAAAREILRRLGVLAPEVKDERGDGEPGLVIAQVPEAGAALGPDSAVTLTVRRAPDGPAGPKFLPGFIGAPLAEAEAKLKALGLRAKVERKVADGPPDIVLDQTPAEGAPLVGLAVVGLVVSQAPDAPPATVTVPDVMGKPADLAVELLKAADLRAKVSETADPAREAGVIAQTPKAGEVVKRGSTVEILANVPPPGDAGRVLVPNLLGRKSAEAQRLLAGLGLKAEVETVADAAPRDTVLRQSPEGGARTGPGAIVALAVSAGPARTARRPAELRPLLAEMARDARAEEQGLTAAGLATLFRSGGVDDLDAARGLAELEPEALRDRLKLRNKTAAADLRAILRRGLRRLD